MKKIRLRIRKFLGCGLAIFFTLLCFPQQPWAKDVTITPAIALKTVYDDNLDFSSNDEKDSFGANAVPSLTLEYASELLQFSLIGEVDVIKYFTESDYDRTNQLYGFDGQYRLAPRWEFAGNFQYRRDETVDSVLEETGQVLARKRVTTYDSGAGLFFQLTELSDIGLETEYRKRDYSSDQDTDFNRYTFSLPYRKRFANQRDVVSLSPAYSIFDSDGARDAKDYRFEIQWDRKVNETLNSIIGAGVRYTDIDKENGSSDGNWGYLGRLGLEKETETFFGRILAERDIRANTDAEIVEVNRLTLSVDKQLRARFGFKFYGAGYYSNTESGYAKDAKTVYYELKPSLYYLLTENHYLELTYQYQNQKEFDRPGNPVTQRNRAYLGIVLQFPKKWN